MYNTPSLASCGQLMAQTYSISDLAREFGITTRTIRFYEDKSLLSPSREGQTRVFSSSERVKLKLILRGKRLGLSLQESAEIIQMYAPGRNNAAQLEQLLQKITERREVLEQQHKDILSMMEDLNNVEQRCKNELNKHPEPS